MTSRDKNQNDIINSELINSYNIDYVFSDRPINRFKTKPLVEDISNKLNDLITEIQNIQNCELKNSANTNLLILDEIFDSSLDANGTEEFMKIISNLTSNSNVFVISHKGDQLSDKFSDIIKFQKHKNFSAIVS